MSRYQYQPETRAEYEKVATTCRGKVSHEAAALGMNEHEPLLVALDSLIRYAKAHRRRYDSFLAEDGFAWEPWFAAVKGIRTLLSCDGGVAMERDISTDSKDNGMIEGLFWRALQAAGYGGEDL